MKDELLTFYIPKPKGYRKIVTYKFKDGALYHFHEQANISLQKRLKQSIFAKAYIRKRSIITNARAHMYNDIFISMDIKDFFQSISHQRLIEVLYYEINKNYVQHFSKAQCEELVKSCSTSNKGIAIGLKPSPILANIYLKDFDGILYGWLKQLGLKNIIYTRYADDLMISYKSDQKGHLKVNDEIIFKVAELLKKNYLYVNDRKTRIINLNISNHVRVTGINITKDANNFRTLTIGRKLKNELYHRALKLCQQQEKNEDWWTEANKIRGLQSFILSVEGKNYQQAYSNKMITVVNEMGYVTLKDMIDSFKFSSKV